MVPGRRQALFLHGLLDFHLTLALRCRLLGSIRRVQRLLQDAPDVRDREVAAALETVGDHEVIRAVVPDSMESTGPQQSTQTPFAIGQVTEALDFRI